MGSERRGKTYSQLGDCKRRIRRPSCHAGRSECELMREHDKQVTLTVSFRLGSGPARST